MFLALQILSVVLVAVAMALALAHALELPGKMRLSNDEYLTVQPIYYPGFAIGGMAEPLGIVAMLALLLMTPKGTATFWLTAGSLAALTAMHALYWLLTHPVNNFWLKDTELKGAGKSFFALGSARRRENINDIPWTLLRDRWELSHLVRAVFGLISPILLAAALAVDRST